MTRTNAVALFLERALPSAASTPAPDSAEESDRPGEPDWKVAKDHFRRMKPLVMHRAAAPDAGLRERDRARLSQGDGCDANWVEPGDRMHVLYDPEEVADPVKKSEADMAPESYRGGIGGLAAPTLVIGTWGCARLHRRVSRKR